MEIGESWDYRARAFDRSSVTVHRSGDKKSARVPVKYVDDECKGSEEWVPPARLKVPWTGVGELARAGG
jgi:hypothetical protein